MALRRILKFIVWSTLGVLILAIAAATWVWRDYQAFLNQPLAISQADDTYTVERGASLGRIAAELEERGVLSNALYLKFLGRQRGDALRIKAGEYALAADLTPDGLLDLLVSGKVIEYSVTFVEGWTFRQTLQALRDHPVVVHTFGEDMTTDAVMKALGHPDLHPEGRFFPDTYLFPKGTTDIQILERAFTRMSDVLAEEWEARAPELPLDSPEEALILASIIEKETGVAGERPEIAGVFVRRLRKGMLLQTDPTVIYGMGEDFDGNLRRRDLTTDTPYNTYTRGGLTPTPICMPGRDAINAALHPADGDALYFVATGDGGHYFSATLNEHNRAVRRYQIERNR